MFTYNLQVITKFRPKGWMVLQDLCRHGTHQKRRQTRPGRQVAQPEPAGFRQGQSPHDLQPPPTRHSEAGVRSSAHVRSLSWEFKGPFGEGRVGRQRTLQEGCRELWADSPGVRTAAAGLGADREASRPYGQRRLSGTGPLRRQEGTLSVFPSCRLHTSCRPHTQPASPAYGQACSNRVGQWGLAVGRLLGLARRSQSRCLSLS